MNENDDRCPSQEELSEYYDLLRSGREYAAEAQRLHGHISHCAECRRTIDVYRRMDRMIASVVTPPADLSDAIKARCQEDAEQTEMRQLAFRDFWRGLLVKVAVIVVLLGVGYVCLKQGDAKRMSEEIAKAAGKPSSKGQQAVEQPRQDEPTLVAANDKASVALPEATSHKAVDIRTTMAPRDLQTVGMGRQRTASSGQAEPGHVLLGNVRHIWMVDDVPSCIRELKEKAALLGVSGVSSRMSADGAVVSIQGIEDRKLQQLVNELDGAKWALVSPMAPQPRQESQVVFTGRKVNYAVNLVKAASGTGE